MIRHRYVIVARLNNVSLIRWLPEPLMIESKIVKQTVIYGEWVEDGGK